ncbi:MAG: MBL fold metallo-hydrolase [Cytophagales bacterium]|jgi:ribonuclease Z|nr:MBL fold metallo-hydrolase [Cytophagales bacterium]
MKLTITGYSTALFSTWYFIEEFGILFDAGDGLTASLLHKSRKIKNVFISHADRDHVTGLLQFNQLNADNQPTIYYPRDSMSFPYLDAFFKKFDPHNTGTVWTPVIEKETIKIKQDLLVETIRNGHIASPGSVCKSLSYKVIQTKRKLKPELAKLPGSEIKRIIEEQGQENTSTEVRTTLVSYSGDTPVEDLERFDNSEILIHEATFLSKGDAVVRPHKNLHSNLEEVMEMVSQIKIGTLVLGHFSSRYAIEQIDRSILELCEKHAINIPVFRVPCGETAVDILSANPINK